MSLSVVFGMKSTTEADISASMQHGKWCSTGMGNNVLKRAWDRLEAMDKRSSFCFSLVGGETVRMVRLPAPIILISTQQEILCHDGNVRSYRLRCKARNLEAWKLSWVRNVREPVQCVTLLISLWSFSSSMDRMQRCHISWCFKIC